MVAIKKFVFGPFQENTYVLYGEQKNCWIIDPGCYFPEEHAQLLNFIQSNGLRPVRLINTHCHIDHVFGNYAICEKFELWPEFHRLELPVYDRAEATANLYNLQGYEHAPDPLHHISEGDVLTLDETSFEVLFVPGHSPGHIALYQREEQLIISGDVLFRGSIGRTDLPGGDHETLISNIRQKLLVLPSEVIVYSGHGPETRIGEEKRFNPFLQ